MEKFITFLETEWSTLTSAPWTFVTLGVLTFGVAYLVVKWRYETIVFHLRERLDKKEEQISIYRDRLDLAPEDEGTDAELSNGELRERTMGLVRDLREFIRQWRARTETSIFRHHGTDEMTDEERSRQWKRETEELTRQSRERKAEYERRFKADTIVLRDELLSRLPDDFMEEGDDYRISLFEHPTNPIGMEKVATTLERMAKNLPETNSI